MGTESEIKRTFKVGAVVVVSLAVLMLFLFFIGAEQKLFSRKVEYKLRVENVSGLAEGNPVQLSGVTVGTVREIKLSENPARRDVAITIHVDRKFRQRIRMDSRARVKRLGLVAADSYVEISPGTLAQPELPPGSLIPAARATNVDKILASGEDLVDNFLQISYSLKNVLDRVDRGEGLLGELTTTAQGRQRITDTALATLNRTNAILVEVQQGRGMLGRMVYDDQLAAQLTSSLRSSVNSLQSITSSIERGEGALGVLLKDPHGQERVTQLVENLAMASENLAVFSEGLKTGEGLLPRLINDREYGDQTLREFQGLVSQLNDAARKVSEGEGTAGRLISDPSLYEAINDIVIGINESKLLRWFVRNRQQKGIETRYKAAQRVEKTAEPAPAQPAAQPAKPTTGNGDGALPPPATTSSTPPPRGPEL